MRRLLGIIIVLFFVAQNAAVSSLKGDMREFVSNDDKAQSIQSSVNLQEDKIQPLQLNPKMFNYTLPIKPDGIIYQEEQKAYNAVDPTKANNVNSYYPGLRGPNQLIIYTPAYGLRTGTNEFGTEAIVEDNMVVRLNGADSVIPKNGFVISGHGKAKDWIMKNVQVGSKVYIDYSNGLIRVFLTPESLIYAAKQKLLEVNSLVEYYKKFDILYNNKKAGEYLESSKEYLRKAEKKPDKTQAYINNAMDLLNSAIKNAIPYNANELKGIWVRPKETTNSEIVKSIERIYSAGITDIFLETYFHGKTIYPSDYMRQNGVIWQREEFQGFDPLEIWIKEAHKRKMKVHIWFETFYAGIDNPQYTPNHVLSVYPLWANKRLANYDSLYPVPSLSEHNGYFLDPANPQVQVYLLGILSEIITKYKPDGINLDYIRYPQTVDSSYSNYTQSNWGYTLYARNDFQSLYGIDPINITYGCGDWELWSAYRQNKISEFVKKVQQLTKPKNILLTAVIFPDLRKSQQTKMQNWRVWSFNNYIDGLTPLILTGDRNTADLLLKDVTTNTSSYTKIYPGIFVTFMGGPFEDLLIQIHKTRIFNTRGAILFDYAHLSDEYIDALKTRVFNKSYDERDEKMKQIEQQNSDYKPQVRYKDKKKRGRRK